MQIPDDFLSLLGTISGASREALLETFAKTGRQCLLPNKTKASGKGEPLDRVPWANEIGVFPFDTNYRNDPFYHLGAYEVGEASHTFLLEVVRQKAKSRKRQLILDLSCNGGFNSMALSQYFDESCLILCNEEDEANYESTKKRLGSWGHTNIWLSNHKVHELRELQGLFDIVIVNPPSSDEGLFRLNHKIIQNWSPELQEACSMIQKNFLQHATPLLKEQGIMIYCNHAYNESETILNVEWIYDNAELESLPLLLKDEWNVKETQQHEMFSYRMFPNESVGEGFFISCFMALDYKEPILREANNYWRAVRMSQLETISPWIEDTWRCLFYTSHKNQVYATAHMIPKEHKRILQALEKLSPGVFIGTFVNKAFNPSHFLGLNTLLTPAVAKVELEKNLAQMYIEKRDFPIPKNVQISPGWLTLSYKSLRLGWIKVSKDGSVNLQPVKR